MAGRLTVPLLLGTSDLVTISILTDHLKTTGNIINSYLGFLMLYISNVKTWRTNTLVVAKEEGRGRDGLGVWGS